MGFILLSDSSMLSLTPLKLLKSIKTPQHCKTLDFFSLFSFFRRSLFIQKETLLEVLDMTGSVLLISSAGRVWQRLCAASASQRACDWSRIQQSNSVLSLVYQSRCTVAPAHTSTRARRVVCCSNKRILKWYCGALVFFLLVFFKGYCCVVREAERTESSDCRFTRLSHSEDRNHTISIDAGSSRLHRGLVLTQRGNKMHSTLRDKLLVIKELE